ncbi:cordon-bleu protein-like 1 [Anoplopoma fimbria]|uniref:cordon-bleu protein-like 1 n=1 Tax=Anoplopoma fimbria TaxID=229290 RepID=UPI0023EBFCEF|nr:cordon-bleu protein-like 1 [Anoplopoma fimbria]XP_054479892.1 cordon-bleu protein-like 1 [Anoplopoma fimbria]
MDDQENPLERDHSLSVVLPGGLEKNATVHGSKPVMDLLVTLCASYHLNPSDYTVEVLSPNKNNIGFKPNSPIGSLDADTIVLKPKGIEEIRRPYMPEASVRLLINYNKSHKAVVRVNPRVPLETLLPVVCDKCEFPVETTVLLRDSQSREPLDLTETLNDLGVREVFAKDTAAKEPDGHQHQPSTPEAGVTPTEVISPPPPQDLPKKEKKQKDNTGLLSLFRKKKKKGEMRGAGSVPASPGRNAQVEVGVSSSNTLPADMPKKRRAPQPPMGASQSVPNNLSTCHVEGSQRSAESTLRSTKRRAPRPPCANTEVKGTLDSLNAVEELTESDESDSVSPASSSSSPYPSLPRPSSSSSRLSFAHLHEMNLPSFRGKDLSDARCALAKILTSSVSKGTLVKHLRNSASFPKFYNGSSFMTQRCSDNGLSCAQPEPVFTSKLPTEHEWEDPPQRRGMTTFKVVPSKMQKTPDTELTPDQITVEEDPESEASPEAERNPTEAEGDPRSPDGSETGTPLQSPEPSFQEIPDSTPPPDDLEIQEGPGSPVSEVGDTVENPTEEDEPEVTSEVTPADCSDGEVTSEGQEDETECQSPTEMSGSTDMDRCGSYTEEKEEEEEEVVQEEEEEGDCFPPPPPPILFDEHIEEEEEGEDRTTSSPPSSLPTSPTSNGQTHAFSKDHQPTSGHAC